MSVFELIGNNWWFLVFLIVPLAIWVYRHNRSYRKLLSAELGKFGFEYLSEESLAAFDAGPFRKGTKRSGPQSYLRVRLFGMRDYWQTYRKVYFLDQGKEMCASWVRIRYEQFSIKEIHWNPALKSFS